MTYFLLFCCSEEGAVRLRGRFVSYENGKKSLIGIQTWSCSKMSLKDLNERGANRYLHMQITNDQRSPWDDCFENWDRSDTIREMKSLLTLQF